MDLRVRRAVRPSRPDRPGWLDVVLAAALFAVDLLLFVGVQGVTPVEASLLAVGFVALVWRRVAPRLVLFFVLAHSAITAVLQPDVIPTLSVLSAVYTVASQRPLRPSLEALAVAAVVVVPAQVARESRDAGGQLSQVVAVELGLFMAGLVALAWAAGRWAGASRARIVSLEERRQQAAAEAVAAERRRMARELHDVVSHAVSVMVLQAAGARRVLAGDPARAEEALGRIENLGKQSMTELRRLLGVLRAGEFVEPGGDDTTRPGLERIGELVGSFREGGLNVTSEVAGHPQSLDPSVDLSAFRVVQESLTNAAKHAGDGASVRVRQVWADDALVLEIIDDGDPAGGRSAAAGLSTGHGLAGLRERARAVGGRLDAGPLPDGRGFCVTASLPTRPTGRTPAGDQLERSP